MQMGLWRCTNQSARPTLSWKSVFKDLSDKPMQKQLVSGDLMNGVRFEAEKKWSLMSVQKYISI